MLMQVMLALLSCLPWSPERVSTTTGAAGVVAQVRTAGEQVAIVVAIEPGPLLLLASGADTGGAPEPAAEQVLTTTVQDPGHPAEPWVVTTYRRPDESFEAFIRRHREMVEAVRKALTE